MRPTCAPSSSTPAGAARSGTRHDVLGPSCRRLSASAGSGGSDSSGVLLGSVPAARDNAYLYGQHCAVDGCERPGNDLIVDSRRLCQRHARRFQQATLSIDEFLAAAPAIAARTALTGLPRYDLSAASPITRDELRFLMQSMHDGCFSLTFSTRRWNALRAIYETGAAEALIDIDLAMQPPKHRGGVEQALSAIPARDARPPQRRAGLAPR